MPPRGRGECSAGPRPCARRRRRPRPRSPKARSSVVRRAASPASDRARPRASSRSSRSSAGTSGQPCVRAQGAFVLLGGDVEGEPRRRLVAGLRARSARLGRRRRGVPAASKCAASSLAQTPASRPRVRARARSARAAARAGRPAVRRRSSARTSACANVKRSRTPEGRTSRARSAASSASSAHSRSTSAAAASTSASNSAPATAAAVQDLGRCPSGSRASRQRTTSRTRGVSAATGVADLAERARRPRRRRTGCPRSRRARGAASDALAPGVARGSPRRRARRAARAPAGDVRPPRQPGDDARRAAASGSARCRGRWPARAAASAASARSRWRSSSSDRSSAQCRSSSTSSTRRRRAGGLQQRCGGLQRAQPLDLGLGRERLGTTPGTRAASSGSSGIRSLARAPELRRAARRPGRRRRTRHSAWANGCAAADEAVVAAAVEHEAALAARVRGDLGRQARLADARLAADEDAAAASRRRRPPTPRAARRALPRARRTPAPPSTTSDAGSGTSTARRAVQRTDHAARTRARSPSASSPASSSSASVPRPGEQAHGVGDEDAPRRRGGTQPLRLDHGRAGVVVARPGDVARADTDAQLQRDRAAHEPGGRSPAASPRRRRSRRRPTAKAATSPSPSALTPIAAVHRQHIAQPSVVLAAHRVGIRVAQPRAHRAEPASSQTGSSPSRGGAPPPAPAPGRRAVEQRRDRGRGSPAAGARARVRDAGRARRRASGPPPGRRQRLALAPGAIQREHELPAQPLAQRLGRHQPLQLAHELATAAHRQIGLDAILDRRRAQVLQARDLGRRERLERHVGQRRPAPLRQRRAQPRRRAPVVAGRQRAPPVLAQPLEPPEVKLIRLDAQPIAGRAADQPRRPRRRARVAAARPPPAPS